LAFLLKQPEKFNSLDEKKSQSRNLKPNFQMVWVFFILCTPNSYAFSWENLKKKKVGKSPERSFFQCRGGVGRMRPQGPVWAWEGVSVLLLHDWAARQMKAEKTRVDALGLLPKAARQSLCWLSDSPSVV